MDNVNNQYLITGNKLTIGRYVLKNPKGENYKIKLYFSKSERFFPKL